jgi:hypothetical protein
MIDEDHGQRATFVDGPGFGKLAPLVVDGARAIPRRGFSSRL